MGTESVQQKAPKSLRHMLEEMLLTKTQDAVAESLGVSQQWVSAHVGPNGSKTVQKKVMPTVAKGLGMTVPELARLCQRRNTNKLQ